ncbi:uncharacterized protein BX664DRAFT_321895 [Halteromyces radiatus]|uniref:uncharacterized protein n=1 Tax=Halteromyces radiatus TaxID=101107 RepID=UPI00221EE551|nr:uncharacterized protein BX664DRAFT_321895 [Halteromyces radiatus]KAI8099698.1 hypothetical protein BX664DRAFT_321895 [Halteromyces radiatus]
MLREKSGNTLLSSWLKQTSSQPSSSMGSQRRNENSEEEDQVLQRILHQSYQEHLLQQKQQYEKFSSQASHFSTQHTLPSIDNEEEWFQTVSPRFPKNEKKSSTSLNKKKQKSDQSPAAKRKSSQQSRNTMKSNKKGIEHKDLGNMIEQGTSSTHQQQQIQQSNDDRMTFDTLLPNETQGDHWEITDSQTLKKEVKNDDDSWEIHDSQVLEERDEIWEIHGSQALKQEQDLEEETWEIHDSQMLPKQEEEEEEAWEIHDSQTRCEDTSNATSGVESDGHNSNPLTIDNTINTNDEELDQYMMAIRNRTTRKPPSRKKTQSSSSSTQRKRPATQLDDVFHLINDKPSRRKTRANYTTIESDPSYNPRTTYQTQIDQQSTMNANSSDSPMGITTDEIDDNGNDSECSSVIDLCLQSDNDINEEMIFLSDSMDDTGMYDDLDTDIDTFNHNFFDSDDDDDRNDNTSFSGPTATLNDSMNTASPMNNESMVHQQLTLDHTEHGEENTGYLSPLEGFVSLLDVADTEIRYRPYFDQLAIPSERKQRQASSSSRSSTGKSRSNKSWPRYRSRFARKSR